MIVSITYDSACAGGGHTTLAVAVDGVNEGRLRDEGTDELLTPLSRDEKRQLARFLVRAKVGGMTRPQARLAMQAGISVTL